MRGRNEQLRNVGRLRLAAEKAAQLRALPGRELNRRADVVIRCPRAAVLCRVFRLPAGLLALPEGQQWFTQLQPRHQPGPAVRPEWNAPEPYWLTETITETITASCSCCRDVRQIQTTIVFDALTRGQRSVRLGVR